MPGPLRVSTPLVASKLPRDGGAGQGGGKGVLAFEVTRRDRDRGAGQVGVVGGGHGERRSHGGRAAAGGVGQGRALDVGQHRGAVERDGDIPGGQARTGHAVADHEPDGARRPRVRLVPDE